MSSSPQPELSGRVAAVVGASGTIGQAVQRALLARGAEVVAIARRQEPGDGAPAGVHHVNGVDLAGRPGLEECVRRLAAAELSPDILVWLAALPSRGDIADLSDDDLAASMFVKVWGPALLTDALAPAMAGRGWGRVILATGITGREPVDGYLAGAAANAAARSMAKGLALRWGGSGITVNAVSPGPVASGRLDAVRDAVADHEPRNPFMRGPEGMLTGRYLHPDEVAAAVGFLCGEGASGINGIELLVDGAASLGL